MERVTGDSAPDATGCVVDERARVPRLVVIVGPTGAGKTRLAMALAERLGGEVVSADSQQVYAGMDIGTGKVTAAERARVPHHVLDALPFAAGVASAVAERLRRARSAVPSMSIQNDPPTTRPGARPDAVGTTGAIGS